ncbi:hypothetical protein SEA_CHEWYVIII_71 [Rhodococcus phage ChewyVIII]|uniref:Uncharacterized protein n=1 Tax=Rhodococcus phage ChewyVIII TaxID=1887657 RepID=A0A1C9EI94_9CAUD|nr:hypothetical protein QEH30_gp71 [Rhodococcus phage ChewyVIII]AON97492.1 hypothetical protein SEA_CHEWYVIII_71 [Rhodococcus phage ChewyVIII]
MGMSPLGKRSDNSERRMSCDNCGKMMYPDRLHIIIERATPDRPYGDCILTVNNWEEGRGLVIFQ